MSVTRQEDLLSNAAKKILEEATSASLDSTFHVIISFHLMNKFGRNPYEVLIEDPVTFFNGLKEILGKGAEAVLNLVGTYLTTKYGMNCTAQGFVALFTEEGKPSAQKLAKIFENVVRQETTKLGTQ